MGPCLPEIQILVETTTDRTTDKTDTQQAIDSTDTEPPLVACVPSDCQQSLPQKVSQKVENSFYLNIEN